MTVALLFSPQGSQSIGMGRDLAEGTPGAMEVFEAADAVLGWSVRELAWEGPAERLNETQWTQPALLTTSVAALAALRARIDPAPAFVAGHSVGEYAALVAAGVLSFPDAVRLVTRRGELMAEARVEGGMAAVIGLDRATVAGVIAAVATPADLVVANDNAPGQVVISGTGSALVDAEIALRDAGARRVISLPVSGPFHSGWMAEVCDNLAHAMEEAEWHDAEPPMISNVTAEPVQDAGTIRALLAEQVRSPVEWVASVRRMVDAGVDTFIECGPGAALTGMVRRIAPEARTLNVADIATLETTAAAVGALGVGAPT
ncbi:MAG: ACP S-malonyltransferase [Chloroflexota bacterium]